MQTNFTESQLEDPKIADANSILRNCVHCGFCTATCPTYTLLGDELDSPRGRIYLIKDMLENDRPATEQVVKHIDRCLSCLSCMSTCPSGVHYMHLVDQARAHIEETYERPLMDRLLRNVLALILPYPARFRIALRLAGLGRFAAPLFKLVPPLKPVGAMLELAPSSMPKPKMPQGPDVFEAKGNRRARVALLTGCAQKVLKPAINEATVRLLNRLGVEIVVPEGEECCGSLVHHMGREDASLDAARANVDAWTREIEAGGLDAIIINASGCGTTVKDYGYMLRLDPDYAEKAARVSALTRDVTEFLTAHGVEGAKAPRDLTVAYHSACSMQHGQQIKTEPKSLLAQAGFTVRDVPEGHLCCGSAGIYNIMQSEIAGQLKTRKVANIESVSPDVIATGNIGCITQIATGTEIPVVHTVELLDWATGGPRPVELAQVNR